MQDNLKCDSCDQDSLDGDYDVKTLRWKNRFEKDLR